MAVKVSSRRFDDDYDASKTNAMDFEQDDENNKTEKKTDEFNGICFFLSFKIRMRL